MFAENQPGTKKAKAAFKEVFAVNEIKIYPNPIAVNSNFNIGFNLKEQGDYIVQFTGRIGQNYFKQAIEYHFKKSAGKL